MIARILLSEWFGFVLVLLMVACVGYGSHSDGPPTEFEQVMAYGSIALAGGWFVIKGWWMWRGWGDGLRHHDHSRARGDGGSAPGDLHSKSDGGKPQ